MRTELSSLRGWQPQQAGLGANVVATGKLNIHKPNDKSGSYIPEFLIERVIPIQQAAPQPTMPIPITAPSIPVNGNGQPHDLVDTKDLGF